MKHTPGPWFIANSLSVVRENPITFDMDIICHTKNNADAKLIAAAPDLLEALEGLQDMLNNHYGDDPEETHLIDKAFDAIKKACGL